MRNTILIVFDELTCYSNLPSDIVDGLKGYQLFKSKCIEFTNIQTSRQQCTPSRSTIITGIYDTSCQDNMEFNYQYDYFPCLPYSINTIGKIYKKNNYQITTYYGKQHLDSKLAIDVNTKPTFNTGTTDTMKIYGYDKFNIFGDTYYHPGKGLLSDNQVISYELPPNSVIYDYVENGIKYSGVIPFLKARLEDNKSYYLECHITNPHDTNHFIQNLKENPAGVMNQFPVPFIDQQLTDDKVSNPYYFNPLNNYAIPTHPNLLKNYFESNYSSYKTNKFTLPFLTSYELDYATEPKINSINPLMVGTYYALKYNMTMSDSQDDIKDWKNFLNNYYGLVYEADSYLERLYYFFESNGIFETTNIIIISDHGDMLSSHGLKQKQLPFKECSNVPCLIYSPDLDYGLSGTKCDLYGSLVDILPTQLVLNNICSDTTFDGIPLLIWSKCNKLIVNTQAHTNYNPINIVNSTMYSLNYFFYLIWYKQNYKTQTLTNNPSNMFDFQSSFVSVITNVDGTNYKFGRYYSVFNVIKYLLFMKPEQNLFKKNTFIEYIKNYSSIISKKTTIEYVVKKFPIDFSFEQGLNIIQEDFGSYNIYLYYIYYAFISNQLNAMNDFMYYIPGSLSNWDTNYQFGMFSYFLYNTDIDNSESLNLLDISNINYVSNELKNKLNNILNISLKEKNCYQIKTILAENTFLQLGELLYVIGGFVNEHNENLSLTILGTLNGENGLDTQITFSTINKFNQYLRLQINLINSDNYKNPYNLYDSENKLYYVGEYKYIQFIYSNMGYFSKFTFNQGLPNLLNTKFQTESNNILPLLNVYKIIE